MLSEVSVVIVGAGVGGLAFAQGLARNGIDFRVLEKDASLSARTQGYRVRISEEGIQALRQNLTPELLQTLFRVCSPSTTGSGNAPRLHLDATTGSPIPSPFKPVAISTTGDPLVADRSVLRQVLSSGLGDSLMFDAAFDHYDSEEDGIVVHLKDGSSLRCRYLVGCDGIWSGVRGQLLPPYSLCDTTGRVVYGKTLLSPTFTAQFSPDVQATNGMSLIRDQAGDMHCLLEPMRFSRQEAAVALPSDYVYWVLFLPPGLVDVNQRQWRAGTNEDSRQLVRRLTGPWHTSLRCLFDDAQMSLARILSSHPEIPSWGQEKRVTLVGDAIHAMAPTAAFGATTALHSAGMLAKKLAEAKQTGDHSVTPLREYESTMREFAGAAVKRSGLGAQFMFRMPAFDKLEKISGTTAH